MGMGRKKSTNRHGDTKLLVICGSFLAFAALTAFISSREPPEASSPSAPAVAERTADDTTGGTIAEQPTPVTRTRGT